MTVRRGRREEVVGFGLVVVLSWVVVVLGQEVAPRPSGGVGVGLLSLPEVKERQEEVMLHQWKQGMDEAAEFVVEALNEKAQEFRSLQSKTPAKGKGAAVPSAKQYELDRLEYEKSGVFRAVMYSLQLRIGRNYLPFTFVSKLTPRFSWLEPVAASEEEEVMRDGTIPSVTLRGPIELYMAHAREVDLRLPHSTDIGLVKKITLGEGVNVTVTGLTSMELVGPMDISVGSRDPTPNQDEGTEHTATPQIVLKWNSTPKLRLQFGSRALMTSTATPESPRPKVKRVTKDSIEILNPAALVIPQGASSSKKPVIFGELPLDFEDSKTFWRTYQLHAKRLLPDSDPSASQISIDNLHIVAGKAEAVLGFWVSLRLEESEEGEDGQWLSPEEVKASGLTPLHSHWKALAVATVPEQYQPIQGDIDATGLTHFNQGWGRGRAGGVHKHYEWKGITTLYKMPSSVPEITLEPGMLTQRNETLGLQLEELKGLLGTSNLVVGTEPRPPL